MNHPTRKCFLIIALATSANLLAHSVCAQTTRGTEHPSNAKTPGDINELTTSNNLTMAARRALALKVAKNLDAQMAGITDPDVMLTFANQLSLSGIAPEVSALEYFGENPVSQADLKPVAETAKRLYRQVSVLAANKSDVLAKSIKTNRDFARVQPQLQKLVQQKTFGEFSDNMGSYALCISLPKDDPDRKKLAGDTISYLKQYDNETSTIQSGVRLQTGKLQLLENDFSDAQTTFDTIVAGTGITPAPSVGDQNNARYFGIVAMINAHKLINAEKAITDLENWEIRSFLPTLPNPSDQDAVKAALSMLKFRLYSAQSDLANIADEKKAKNDAAIDILAQLLKAQPKLKDLVFDQLVGRIPEKPDYSTLNPLILQALQQQGLAEVIKPEGAAVDQKKLTRAIEAAKEIFSRNGQPGVDAGTAGLSAYFIAYAYERMKMDKEAAAAFLDFAEKFPNDKDKSNDALEHAGKWVLQLHAKQPEDQDVRQLYDRFLPLAINPPYNRKDLAFRYAALLQGESKFKEAVQFFEMVPRTDKRYSDAQYLELLSLYKELSDPAMVGPGRQQLVNQILDIAKGIDSLLANATTPQDKTRYVEWVVVADEIAADLTLHELNDSNKSLEILNGFEDRVAGAKDPQKAHLDALPIRISAYMAAKKTDDAVKTLVTLLEGNPAQGQALMFDVLKSVENDENNTKDPATKISLAQAKVTLMGFIVDWSAKSKDAKVQAALPIYEFNDAEANREAAELNPDPTAKKAGLTAALKRYQALYDKARDDASLQGIGLTQYDLGNYQQAMDVLGSLVTGNKVGQPLMPLGTGGAEQLVENPQFWETNFKDIRSIVEVYKKNPTAPDARKNLEAARQYIGVLYINNGKNTGGKTYHDDFENLKAEITKLQSGNANTK